MNLAETIITGASLTAWGWFAGAIMTERHHRAWLGRQAAQRQPGHGLEGAEPWATRPAPWAANSSNRKPLEDAETRHREGA